MISAKSRGKSNLTAKAYRPKAKLLPKLSSLSKSSLSAPQKERIQAQLNNVYTIGVKADQLEKLGRILIKYNIPMLCNQVYQTMDDRSTRRLRAVFHKITKKRLIRDGNAPESSENYDSDHNDDIVEDITETFNLTTQGLLLRGLSRIENKQAVLLHLDVSIVDNKVLSSVNAHRRQQQHQQNSSQSQKLGQNVLRNKPGPKPQDQEKIEPLLDEDGHFVPGSLASARKIARYHQGQESYQAIIRRMENLREDDLFFEKNTMPTIPRNDTHEGQQYIYNILLSDHSTTANHGVDYQMLLSDLTESFGPGSDGDGTGGISINLIDEQPSGGSGGNVLQQLLDEMQALENGNEFSVITNNFYNNNFKNSKESVFFDQFDPFSSGDLNAHLAPDGPYSMESMLIDGHLDKITQTPGMRLSNRKDESPKNSFLQTKIKYAPNDGDTFYDDLGSEDLFDYDVSLKFLPDADEEVKDEQTNVPISSNLNMLRDESDISTDEVVKVSTRSRRTRSRRSKAELSQARLDKIARNQQKLNNNLILTDSNIYISNKAYRDHITREKLFTDEFAHIEYDFHDFHDFSVPTDYIDISAHYNIYHNYNRIGTNLPNAYIPPLNNPSTFLTPQPSHSILNMYKYTHYPHTYNPLSHNHPAMRVFDRRDPAVTEIYQFFLYSLKTAMAEKKHDITTLRGFVLSFSSKIRSLAKKRDKLLTEITVNETVMRKSNNLSSKLERMGNGHNNKKAQKSRKMSDDISEDDSEIDGGQSHKQSKKSQFSPNFASQPYSQQKQILSQQKFAVAELNDAIEQYEAQLANIKVQIDQISLDHHALDVKFDILQRAEMLLTPVGLYGDDYQNNNNRVQNISHFTHCVGNLIQIHFGAQDPTEIFKSGYYNPESEFFIESRDESTKIPLTDRSREATTAKFDQDVAISTKIPLKREQTASVVGESSDEDVFNVTTDMSVLVRDTIVGQPLPDSEIGENGLEFDIPGDNPMLSQTQGFGDNILDIQMISEDGRISGYQQPKQDLFETMSVRSHESSALSHQEARKSQVNLMCLQPYIVQFFISIFYVFNEQVALVNQLKHRKKFKHDSFRSKSEEEKEKEENTSFKQGLVTTFNIALYRHNTNDLGDEDIEKMNFLHISPSMNNIITKHNAATYTKRVVSSLFLGLLTLHSNNVVKITQHTAYGDILIHIGPLFEYLVTILFYHPHYSQYFRDDHDYDSSSAGSKIGGEYEDESIKMQNHFLLKLSLAQQQQLAKQAGLLQNIDSNIDEQYITSSSRSKSPQSDGILEENNSNHKVRLSQKDIKSKNSKNPKNSKTKKSEKSKNLEQTPNTQPAPELRRSLRNRYHDVAAEAQQTLEPPKSSISENITNNYRLSPVTLFPPNTDKTPVESDEIVFDDSQNTASKRPREPLGRSTRISQQEYLGSQPPQLYSEDDQKEPFFLDEEEEKQSSHTTSISSQRNISSLSSRNATSSSSSRNVSSSSSSLNATSSSSSRNDSLSSSSTFKTTRSGTPDSSLVSELTWLRSHKKPKPNEYNVQTDEADENENADICNLTSPLSNGLSPRRGKFESQTFISDVEL